MATRYWNPANEIVSLRDAMDRLVADSFINPRTLHSASGSGLNLPASLYETADGYIAQILLPGIDPENVQITVQGESVNIKGERTAPEFGNARQIWSGIGYGQFEQTFTLPAAVETEGAKADYEHGVLTLRLPKTQHARVRTIKVTSNGASKAIEQGGTAK